MNPPPKGVFLLSFVDQQVHHYTIKVFSVGKNSLLFLTSYPVETKIGKDEVNSRKYALLPQYCRGRHLIDPAKSHSPNSIQL
jgi:hypothetical protein